MKTWTVKLEIADGSPGSFIMLYLHIQARSVRKISHERIEADKVIIDLPGDIVRISSKPRRASTK